MSQPISQAELRQHLREHLDWLVQSARTYDAGTAHEAKRLAHTLRSLLHDTRQSHSLLGQLGAKETLRFWSVLPDFGSPSSMFVGVRMEMGFKDGVGYTRYAPNLGTAEQRLPFSDWWEREEIMVNEGVVVTRRRAVLYLANKDGGSHVDPRLSELEFRLLRTDPMGWKAITITGASSSPIVEQRIDESQNAGTVGVYRIEGGTQSEEPSGLGSPLPPMVRQITHEVIGTVREQLAALVV